ncbi:PLP-dependent transferase, partial [Aureobasidium melanogenum]
MHQDRKGDYPQFENVIYLDSAGTPPYSQELIERVHEDLRHRRYANPHSNSGPAQAIANDIQSVRKQVLKFFGASTEDWDVVFVANATAAIKLTADCFRDYAEANGKEFWYGYHRDSHTSMVGARELATAHRCFIQDGDIDEWILEPTRAGHQSKRVNLLAYPGQSNMTGRRLPNHWPGLIRGNTDNESETYTLLDAAALASTSPLDLSKTSTSPDLVAVSFYKIFGYPQLGALIVQKQSAKLRKLLLSRRYFGGGTVDMVTTIGGSWHAKKNGSLHEALEDGTPLTNSIIATKIALECHYDKYGEKPMVEVAKYTTCLARGLVEALSALRHANGKPIIRLYSDFSTGQAQGPVIAFN